MIDKETGYKIIELKDKIVQNFTKSHWQELGMIIGLSDIITKHDRLLRSLSFGDENIDMERVKWAANQAMLDDVIQNLDNSFDTQVGEDGVKLSGGQRQRIGLARALYRMPRLLVLDEATSALDEATESKVMENIYNFSNNCTVIMIAHRLSTIEKADEIIELGNNA